MSTVTQQIVHSSMKCQEALRMVSEFETPHLALLHKHFDCVAVLVDRAPEIMDHLLNSNEDLVDMPSLPEETRMTPQASTKT